MPETDETARPMARRLWVFIAPVAVGLFLFIGYVNTKQSIRSLRWTSSTPVSGDTEPDGAEKSYAVVDDETEFRFIERPELLPESVEVIDREFTVTVRNIGGIDNFNPGESCIAMFGGTFRRLATIPHGGEAARVDVVEYASPITGTQQPPGRCPSGTVTFIGDVELERMTSNYSAELERRSAERLEEIATSLKNER